jgi:PKD repeat protein
LATVSVAISAPCTSTCKDIKITGLTVSTTNGPAPLKVSYSATFAGSCAKVKYEAINAKTGKVVCGGTCNTCSKARSCSGSCTITQPGTYNVKVTAYGSNGCCVTYVKYNAITVTDKKTCSPNFVLTSRSGTTVKFKDTTTGSVASRTWNFGDGSRSTAQNPTHTYAKHGTYSVCLSVKCSSCSSCAAQMKCYRVTV